MTNSSQPTHRERETTVLSGWFMLPVTILMLLGGIALFVTSIVQGARADGPPVWWMFIVGLLLVAAAVLAIFGFFTLQPNEARVLILFGSYKGTVKRSGFHWGNPFYSNGAPTASTSTSAPTTSQQTSPGRGRSAQPTPHPMRRYKISLRARNYTGDIIKVNDRRGNPIEIAAVVVWRVRDTAQAVFDVDDFEQYVSVQSEAAVRHLASRYAYDHGEEDEITLRSNVTEVSAALREELQQRLSKAGVEVEEARLTHLAYAPEIAQAMLRRQQAEAVIAARRKIVTGAVSMVEMALKDLAERHVLELDDERRAAMVSNLLVVLCGESEAQPVINTGTLYT